MKLIKKLFKICTILLLVCLIVLFTINGYVVGSVRKYISADLPEKADCILILGCGVRPDGTPSGMLADRLTTGISLYKKGSAAKIIMSGDHGRATYDEVNLMKQYAIDRGVPSEDIFMDHAGFSTYESMYRARDIFQVESVIVVTQKYHLYRSVYNARTLGLDAVGYSANLAPYRNGVMREIREVFARNKDFIYCIFSPKPTYLGEAIPVSGNGNLTNDK